MAFDTSKIQALFHGTGADVHGAPRPGGYDKVFWTAETSTVAQSYIPDGGAVTVLTIDEGNFARRVPPDRDCPIYSAALRFAAPGTKVEYDVRGKATSYAIGEDHPTYAQVAKYLQEVLGYEDTQSRSNGLEFQVKLGLWNPDAQQYEILRADYKRPGSLMIVTGFENMKLYDMSRGESDGMELQYNEVGFFRRLEAEGYEGVVIDDFAQSKAWGNVDHRSIGFFASSCERLKIEAIPALRFDWGQSAGELSPSETPEYSAWRRARAALDALPRLMDDTRTLRATAP